MNKDEESNDQTKKEIDQNQSLHMPSSKSQTAKEICVDEDRTEIERKKAYIEPKTRDLLRQLLQGEETQEIIPIYAQGLGFIYQITGKKSSENDGIPREFLETLTRLDILKRVFYDSVSSCPNCESAIITLHNRCPKCKSHNVHKENLTEHIVCGYIDEREKYIDHKCPKCGDPLLEGKYRNMGSWFVCQQCGERFENPEFDHICRNCNKNFSIKEAKVIEIPKFSLNPSRKKEIVQNVASLEEIRALLVDIGFTVEIPSYAVGQKSGVRHQFSLMAKKIINKQEIIITLDHSTSDTEVHTGPLILYIYKTSEIKVDIPIFLAIPRLNETGKKIASGHNILLIEGQIEGQESIQKIKNEIQQRINQKTMVSNQAENQQQKNKTESQSFFSKIGLKKKNR